ncbi:MAG: FAD-binding oxidoreductase [Candidatus Bathyarchaeia archaeon]
MTLGIQVTKDFLIESFSKIVGNKNVISEPEALETYSSDDSFVNPTTPLCAVKPHAVEEIQEIVKLADQYKIPVTPVSGGSNNLGGTIPSPNGLVIDLRNMDKILGVDLKSWMASIEPGVTFAQLQSVSNKHGLRVLTPSENPASSSVLSTFLDLVPLYGWVYYGEENLTTMTAVLPSGDLLKTGQAAFPEIRYPYMHSHASPYAGLMNYLWYQSQGTLGIIVQGWVKLKPKGDVEKAFFIPVDDAKDLHKILRAIMWLRYPRDMAILNKQDLALMFAEDSPSYSERVMDMKESLPEWTIMFSLRGRADAVDVMEKDLKDVGITKSFKMVEELCGISSNKILEEIANPAGFLKWRKYKGARNTIPFISSIKNVPEMYGAVSKISEKFGYPKEDLGVTIIPTDRIGVVGCSFSFARDPNSSENTDLVKKVYTESAKALLNFGAFYSRPYGILSDLIYRESQTYYEILLGVKRTIDPNNIMNPRRLRLGGDA